MFYLFPLRFKTINLIIFVRLEFFPRDLSKFFRFDSFFLIFMVFFAVSVRTQNRVGAVQISWRSAGLYASGKNFAPSFFAMRPNI